MSIIEVKDLVKIYKINEKEHGMVGYIKNLFHPKYKEFTAVKGVNFNIEEGELVGYIGENGAGKSTTIKMLTGLLTPTSGSVIVNGIVPNEKRIQNNKQIGAVFGQKTQLWWDLPVIESYRLIKKMYKIPENEYRKNLKKFTEILDLEDLLEKAKANGVPNCRILDREELIAMEPNLSDDVVAAFYAPTGAIVCPFHMTMAFAENAFENGVEFFLNTKVEKIEKSENGYVITTNKDTYEAKAVVNAAGVYADVFNNMVSERKLNIIARKGEYMLLDKQAGKHVTKTIFQLPSKMGKGVLVSPTVHGNLLVGPTATDIEDKEGVNTTQTALDSLASTAALSVKNVPLRQVITSFAGLRAHEADGDFVIGEAKDAKNFYNAAGIESPGLSSAPAIGEYLAEMIASNLELSKKDNFKGTRKGILNPETLTIEERNALIKENPAYGNIICRCEMISEGEILDAIHRPLGARSLDGVKRRTRAGMGRCQAGFCSPRTMEILAREVPMEMNEITKNGGKSTFIVGTNKNI